MTSKIQAPFESPFGGGGPEATRRHFVAGTGAAVAGVGAFFRGIRGGRAASNHSV